MIVDISNPQTPVEMLQKSMFPFINSKLSHWIDAESICQALFGDSVAVNVFLVGVAFQLGKLPISSASIEKAIELNGVQVEKNIAAFRWGRTSIEDRSVLEQKLAPTSIAGVSSPEEKLSRFARKSVKKVDRWRAGLPLWAGSGWLGLARARAGSGVGF